MTEQYKDLIKFRGDDFILDQYPLESYFNQNSGSRPDFLNIELELSESFTINSACHRGYLALWEIRASKLFLTDVISPNMTRSFKENIFETLNGDHFIEASWFTGPLTMRGYQDQDENIKKILPEEPRGIPLNLSGIDYGEYLLKAVGDMEPNLKIELMFIDGQLIR